MSESVITTEKILEALQREYPRAKGWATAREVQDPVSGRRADLMAWNFWDGRTEINEAKMSRADARNDLKNPEKSAPLAAQVTAWWLACPPGVVTFEEAAERGWGLRVIQKDLRQSRSPGVRHDGSPSHGLATAFIRRVLADDSLGALLAEERAAARLAGKKEALASMPAGRYTKQDLENAKERGYNERLRHERTAARKAEGALS